jgi:hypothetical protein
VLAERGQATIEAVGIAVAVALLAGGLAGVLGAAGPAASLAGAIARAVSAAIGPVAGSGRVAPIEMAPAELAAFALAVQPGLAPDSRPTLRDVRLQLEQAHGHAAGDRLLDGLLRTEAESLLPTSGGPTAYRNVPGPDPHGPDAFAPPAPGADRQVESPAGPLQIRAVTAAEGDAWLRHRLDPGLSWADVVTTVAGLVPGERLAASALRAGAGALSAARAAAGSDASSEVPPGHREGDIVVSWAVDRRVTAADGGPPVSATGAEAPARRFLHVAVIRDGVVVAEDLARPPSP